MILSFEDKETELVYNRQFSRKLPQDIQHTALRKLVMGTSGNSSIKQKKQIKYEI